MKNHEIKNSEAGVDAVDESQGQEKKGKTVKEIICRKKKTSDDEVKDWQSLAASLEGKTSS
ncbi:hypothetical protein JBO38_20800 [Enterobacter asburiae]|uniref:hypothetical protein n=1 Tax=Enterobacter asburiae TaxID=61645 RepID=UPI00192AB625|nr:hypothetical protein [Enterobacter asburiae]MBL5950193.1 hypothetical protein [Enterobacter asburiae]